MYEISKSPTEFCDFIAWETVDFISNHVFFGKVYEISASVGTPGMSYRCMYNYTASSVLQLQQNKF